MANISQSNRYQLLATCITAFTFTCVAIAPPPLMAIDMAAQKGLNLNDINFGIKIEKIYEKVTAQKKITSGYPLFFSQSS